jgi:hypothetical protein
MWMFKKWFAVFGHMNPPGCRLPVAPGNPEIFREKSEFPKFAKLFSLR